MIESVADANIGSILGHRLPRLDRRRAAVHQRIRPGGLPGFVARARELAAAYGERFEPPASLVEKAERGEIYSDDAGAGRRRLIHRTPVAPGRTAVGDGRR